MKLTWDIVDYCVRFLALSICLAWLAMSMLGFEMTPEALNLDPLMTFLLGWMACSLCLRFLPRGESP